MGLTKRTPDMRTSITRRCGAALVAGSVAWAACALIAGPIADGANSRLELAGSLAFQLALLCLIAALWVTEATGIGRWGRAALSVQLVLVLLAIGWTMPHIFDPNMADEGMIVALDTAWPLSMLWLVVLGITVARARRWVGTLRWATLVASLWFPVAILATAAGEWPGLVVSSLWLVAGYGVLGALLMRGRESEIAAAPEDAARVRNTRASALGAEVVTGSKISR
jgi:cytochrome bd-type quinol oxidase subunit 2